MFNTAKILYHQGKQYIPDLRAARVPGIFRGRPEISAVSISGEELVAVCPTGAIAAAPVRIDMGRCVFCGECARRFPEKFRFTQDYRISSNSRERLVITEGSVETVTIDANLVRSEVRRILKGSLKLRQVSAGGDNSSEMELNAAGNVNFDMGRYGIEFVASPRHADGIVITGPVSANMSEALRMTWEAVSEPRIIILAGTDAISGGIFECSPAIDRTFVDSHEIDLYVPGNPVHPLTFINGVLDLLGKK